MHNPVRFTSDQNLTDSTFFYNQVTPYFQNISRGGLSREDSASLASSTLVRQNEKLLPQQTSSIFTASSSKKINFVNQPVYNRIPAWLPVIMLIYVLIMAAARRISGNRIMQILKASFSPHYLNQLERDADILKEGNTIGFLVLYLISAALTAVASIDFFTKTDSVYTLSMLGLTSAGLLVFSVLQILMILSTGRIMNTITQSREHILNSIILAETAGVITLPLSVSYIYSGYSFLLYISLGIFTLMLLLRYVRIFIIGISIKQYSLLYLFLYLCTLEILPVLLAVKYASNFA